MSTHLEQAVPDQRHEQLVAVLLAHQRRVLRGVHAREVEHRHVRLPVVVDGKVQRGQLLVSGEICCFPGVVQQSLLVHVLPGEQDLSVGVVLPKAAELKCCGQTHEVIFEIGVYGSWR